MSKPAPNLIPITPETMSKALTATDDFGYEMRVRTLLENNGGVVQHGWTYSDPATGKTRQFDIRCAFRHNKSRRFLQLALECKNLTPESPLIVSGVSRTQSESFHDFIVSSHSAIEGLQGIRRVQSNNQIYPVGEFAGKNLIRLKQGDKGLIPSREYESEIYDRWSQAIASADELCKNATRAAETTPGPTFTVVVPGVVVPDDTLWSLQYDREGNFGSGPVPSKAVSFFLNHKVGMPLGHHLYFSHVEFWTFGGLKQFVANLNSPNANWEDWLPGSVDPSNSPSVMKHHINIL